MSRRKGCTSFAVLNGLPAITTALRLRPAPEPGRRRKRSVFLRLQQASCAVDGVLNAATQQQAYQQLCCTLVDGLLSGESAVLLVYGAHQTGKSYTLQGIDSINDAGIVLQAVQAITKGLSIVPRNKYRLSATYCGLGIGHDAQLVDLLASNSAAASLRDGSAPAAMSVLSSWTLQEPADINEVMRCRRPQQVSASGFLKQAMHTMLTLQLDSYDADGNVVNSSNLSFVELAAPEPKDCLGNSRCIDNATARSLAMAYSSLSKVLQALRHSAPATATQPGPTGAAAAALAAGSQTSMQQLQHVPWRDSPLTRWLQERLHAAKNITLLGTISAAVEDAADTLATINWVSRFSAASKSGAGGVLVSFAWDVAANPQLSGPYMRFHPEQEVIQGPHVHLPGQRRQPQHQQQQLNRHTWGEQRSNTPAANSLCDMACSSPMVNQRSPDIRDRAEPQSAESVSNRLQADCRWQKVLQQHQQPLHCSSVNRNIGCWQQQQEQLQSQAEAANTHSRQRSAAAMLPPVDATAELDQGRLLADEVLMYGELMAALKKRGGNLRAETILQQLLQDLSVTRATAAAGQQERKSLECRLVDLQHQHADCETVKKDLQERNLELQQQLAKLQSNLDEATADRNLFLRRLQQLEAHTGGDGQMSAAELQWQKSYSAQLRMLEAELAAMSSSNQKLRSQLEIATQQLSRSKSAAQSATESNDQLQQEVDVMRSAADIEGELRRELEESVQQLQRACEATAHELSLVTADKVALQKQYADAQESMEALADELQETLGKVDDKEAEVQALAEHLQHEQKHRQEAEQQLSGLQVQVTALEGLTQHLQQQQQQETAQERMWQGEQQETIYKLNRTLEDLNAVLGDFEQDLQTAVPQQWKHFVPGLHSESVLLSPTQIQSNSRLCHRIAQLKVHNSQSTTLTLTAASGDSKYSDHAADMLPIMWAKKLQGVVEVLSMAGEELTHATDQVSDSMRRAELLERNVEELRKLVSTQEDLQQQLAAQLTVCREDADAAAQQHKASTQQLQDSLAEAQAAVAALAEELQECQASLKSVQDSVLERDTALDVLADEYVELSTSHDSLETQKQQLDEQVVALAAEFEETLLQLNIRDQVLDQVWGQLKSLPNCTVSTGNGLRAQSCDSTAQTASLEACSWWQGGGNAARYESASLERLKQQWQQGCMQQRRRSLMAGGADVESPAAGVAYRAVQAARRRTTSTDTDNSQEHTQTSAQRHGGCTENGRLDQSQQLRLTPTHDRLQHAHLHVSDAQRSQSSKTAAPGQVQPLVVAAVQQLRQQFEELQQQLADAQAGRAQDGILQQQLTTLQQQHVQLIATSEQQEQDNLMLQGKCRQLSQQLRTKEMELDHTQEQCQELVGSLKQVQQHLQQQQQVMQPMASIPSPAQQQSELQLMECKRELADAQAKLAEVTAAAAAEKAARIAAEDVEIIQQQLLQQLESVQQELSGVHAQLLAERQANCALREDLTLVTKSRDTWRESAKRAEAAATAAKAAAETKSTELTRARTEVLTLKQQLETTTQQLERQGIEGQKRSELSCTDTLAEGLAARLAAAQVMRREAEDNAAELSRRLLAAERRLQELQQGHQSQLAQHADAAAQQTAVDHAAGQLADQHHLLSSLQVETGRLKQQLCYPQQVPEFVEAAAEWVEGQQRQETTNRPLAGWSSQHGIGSNEQVLQARLDATRNAASDAGEACNDIHPLLAVPVSGSDNGLGTQQCSQAPVQHGLPAISNNNPFYQQNGCNPSTAETAAADGHLLPDRELGSQGVTAGEAAAGFFGGLLSGWRSRSHPGWSEPGDRCSTAVTTADRHQQVTKAGRSTTAGGAAAGVSQGFRQASRPAEAPQVADDQPAPCTSEAPCLY